MTDTISFDGEYLHVGAYKFGNVLNKSQGDHDSDEYSYRHRAVQMVFPNCWVLSIIWGTMTYSSNRNADMITKKHAPEEYTEFTETPTEVEIAAFLDRDADEADPDVGLVEWSNEDTVQGWVTAEELLKLIVYINGLPSKIVRLDLSWRSR